MQTIKRVIRSFIPHAIGATIMLAILSGMYAVPDDWTHAAFSSHVVTTTHTVPGRTPRDR